MSASTPTPRVIYDTVFYDMSPTPPARLTPLDAYIYLFFLTANYNYVRWPLSACTAGNKFQLVKMAGQIVR